MKYLLKIDLQEEAGKSYRLENIHQRYTCSCSCYVFSQSGKEWVCNRCNKRHTVETEDYSCPVCKESYPDDVKCNDKKCIYPQCVSCKTAIKSKDKALHDADKLGPYCHLCFNQLPEELKVAIQELK